MDTTGLAFTGACPDALTIIHADQDFTALLRKITIKSLVNGLYENVHH
jgi:hypothetical protein